MPISQTTLMPREKLLQFGVESLSDAELLALFLRTGTRDLPVLSLAETLLHEFGSFYHLMNTTHEQFCQKPGLGTAKYTQLKAVIELARRYLKVQITHESFLQSPDSTHQFLASHLSHKEQEVFMVIFLNNQNQVIASKEMFIGTYNCVEIHPREIARYALQYNAVGLILAHNHPSGRAEPSQADRDITIEICKTCELLDIRIIDHIVVGKGQYVSFAERGWI
ncbi:DNA repair protein RadC [Orbaceae bacterium ESL0721]|nr:DNA repair protein RadC [Orbaceae bacterium ESL0721]